ncbi:MAG: GxxExxY protein [Chloroflexi bacterium]|nr:GxxExxY protein [Chloroflexota bacterium]MBM3152106.1 GxxExxY protein [Chloroflexota bacterium]
MNVSADHLNKITDDIIGAAIEVHRALGPGLLESAYEACTAFELAERKRKVARQVPLPLTYKVVQLDCGYRLDLLVDDLVIVELKTVDALNAVHKAQILSYLKLTGLHVGLLINFNVKILKHGLVRVVNEFPETKTI